MARKHMSKIQRFHRCCSPTDTQAQAKARFTAVMAGWR